MRIPHLTLVLLALSGCFRVSDDKLVERMDVDQDGVDGTQDCDDHDASQGMPSVWYADSDGDGVGSDEQVLACTAPEGYVAETGDCDDADASQYPGATWYLDDDGDGFGQADSTFESCAPPSGYAAAGTDCDDTRADVAPNAAEVCDGVDNDCDELIDAADTADLLSQEWYRDADGDGHGAGVALSLQACELPGYELVNDDCDDEDASISPEAVEVCNGLDDDCDGLTDDEDDSVAETQPFYADGDGDGFGSGDAVEACLAPTGFAAQAGDCDDTNRALSPAALEVCDGFDNDCDGQIDDYDSNIDSPNTFYLDRDRDSFGDSATPFLGCEAPAGYTLQGGDCDDLKDTVFPTADETCDGVDNDCDGVVDGAGAVDAAVFYLDQDADGFGLADQNQKACGAPANHAAASGDCDDADANTNPAATEICDNIDNNCNGQVDEGAVEVNWYLDADGDGYGDDAQALFQCDQPVGYVQRGGDCDDADPALKPGAEEVCDGVDNDCDSLIDDTDSVFTAPTWYADTDGDQYGDPANTVSACSQPPGYLSFDSDCDDSNAQVNPGAVEVCNGVDDDCDHLADDKDSSVSDPVTWYADDDGDSYGNLTKTIAKCLLPAGYVANSQDCDDRVSGGAAINPAAAEVCNGVDDDCDYLVDDADDSTTGQPTYFADSDKDSFGDAAVTTLSCLAPAGFVADDQDCDDTSAVTYPGATEICDLKDNDCDNIVDEGAVPGNWYPDVDVDGHGDMNSAATVSCSQPAGMVASKDDCDDNNASVHPGLPELCSTVGVDDNCNLAIDESTAADVITWYKDGDADTFGLLSNKRDACVQPAGYASGDLGYDCDDVNAAVNPAAAEVCNNIDDDCDTLIDDADGSISGRPTWYKDADADLYGNPAIKQKACIAPAGMVADATDCNDANAAIHPNADELCATVGVDDNCDTLIDDSSAVDTKVFYADLDADTYGDVGNTAMACVAPPKFVVDSQDCDDTRKAVHPGAVEVCNGLDDDCNNLIDDGTTNQNWFPDVDLDGFGDMLAAAELSCMQPVGKILDNTDCADDNFDVFPGAPEVCNGLDDDCNTLVDDNAVDQVTFYADGDGDGYGNAAKTALLCPPPGNGWVADATDCDDNFGTIHPLAPELCDGVDNDCDTRVDEYCSLLDLSVSAGDWMLEGSVMKGADSGRSAVGLGDLDLVPGVELAIGSPGADRVYVVSSPGNAEALLENTLVLGARGAGEQAGASLAWHPKWGLAVGAPMTPLFFWPAGGVYVVSSPMTATSLSSGVSATSRAANSETGRSVAYYNNGGGRDADTLLAGAPGALTNSGQVFFLDPASPSFGRGVFSLDGDADSRLGLNMARIPDINGDGIEDLLVASEGLSLKGEVFVVPGGLKLTASTSIRAVALGSYTGKKNNDLLGTGLAAADVDQDGNMDLVLGASAAEGGKGAVYVVYGPLTQWGNVSNAAGNMFKGANNGDAVGASVSAGQDLDDDGVPDLLIGAPGWDQINPPITDVGAAYVITARPQKGQNYTIDQFATARYGGLASADRAGAMVCQIGDMSGDKVSDWVIGAPKADGNNVLDAGEVYLFYGLPGGY